MVSLYATQKRVHRFENLVSKVKGHSQPEVGVFVLVALFVFLGSPFLYRSVLILTQMIVRRHCRALCRMSLPDELSLSTYSSARQKVSEGGLLSHGQDNSWGLGREGGREGRGEGAQIGSLCSLPPTLACSFVSLLVFASR